MDNLTPRNIVIQTDGIRMRLVEKSDAKFIVDLRTDEILGRYISFTSPDVGEQIKWINEYKKREAERKEFYFIFEDSNHKPWGTIRIYNLKNDHFSLGSWICQPGKNAKIALKAHIIGLDYGFIRLNYNTCLFDVRKKNLKVVKYLELFGVELIDEDEQNYFFG